MAPVSEIFKLDACRLTLEDLKAWIDRVRDLKPLLVRAWYGGDSLSKDDGENWLGSFPRRWSRA